MAVSPNAVPNCFAKGIRRAWNWWRNNCLPIGAIAGIVLISAILGQLSLIGSELATHFLVERVPEPPHPDGKAYFFCDYIDPASEDRERRWFYSNIVGLDTWRGEPSREDVNKISRRFVQALSLVGREPPIESESEWWSCGASAMFATRKEAKEELDRVIETMDAAHDSLGRGSRMRLTISTTL